MYDLSLLHASYFCFWYYKDVYHYLNLEQIVFLRNILVVYYFHIYNRILIHLVLTYLLPLVVLKI